MVIEFKEKLYICLAAMLNKAINIEKAKNKIKSCD